MNIELKKMLIINFKGIKRLEINFQKETDIHGDNATGKTSIFDAFTWLLFGKDSNDSAKFNIKPLDKAGKPVDKTENEVSAVLIIDGRKTEVKKIFREDWVKKRGEQMQVFKGNENLYYWNDVPLQEKEFNAKVNDIVNPGIFKMLTNTLYFNQQMTWIDRRGVLMSIAGAITNEEIAAGNPEYNALIEVLTNKKLEEYKKEIASKKKKLKESLEHIPARVDEINRGLPDELDWAQIITDIASREAEISEIDSQITNSTEAHKSEYAKIKDQLKEIHDLNLKRDAIAYQIKSEQSNLANEAAANIRMKRAEIEAVSKQIKADDDEITAMKIRKEDTEKEMAALRDRWNLINAEVIAFDDHEFTCPTCKRDFEANDIEAKKAELIQNFTASKKKRLAAITDRGLKMGADVATMETRIGELHEEIETLTDHRGSLSAELETLKLQALPGTPVETIIENNNEYRALADQITKLEANKSEEPKSDTTHFVLQKNELRNEIDALKKQLNLKDRIAESNIRIAELQAEEKELSQQLADLEGTEFLIERFTKAKIDMMEERINGKFKLVSFKMFNYLNNGGVEECCETTINGVPFSDLNTASKINAGIDIINVLCDHYNVHAPVFIDNRESTVNIIPCDSQIINLIVKEGCPLTIDGERIGKHSKELAA